MATEEGTTLKLKVSEALPRDVGRGLARLDPADMSRLGLEVGEIVEIVGPPHDGRARRCRPTRSIAIRTTSRSTGSRARTPARRSTRWSRSARQSVRPAERVVLAPLGFTPADRDLKYIGSLFDGLPVVAERPRPGQPLRQPLRRLQGGRDHARRPGRDPVETVLEIARPQGKARPTGEGRRSAALVRRHRRPEARAAPHPRDHRAAAALSGGLRAAGHRPAQGRACCTARRAAARR